MKKIMKYVEEVDGSELVFEKESDCLLYEEYGRKLLDLTKPIRVDSWPADNIVCISGVCKDLGLMQDLWKKFIDIVIEFSMHFLPEHVPALKYELNRMKQPEWNNFPRKFFRERMDESGVVHNDWPIICLAAFEFSTIDPETGDKFRVPAYLHEKAFNERISRITGKFMDLV